MASSQRIHEIDGLRFLAILAVFGVHYRPPSRPSLDFLALGWSGVDLFFAISGFLITSNLLSLRGTVHPYRIFYWRRSLRIFPAYYLALTAVALASYADGSYPGNPLIVRMALFSTSVAISPVLHALHHGIRTDELVPLDQHVLDNFLLGIRIFWSLSIEEVFYLLWAPVVLKASRFTILTISLSAILLCPILRMMCHGPGFEEYFFFFTRFDALTFGALLALAFAAVERQALVRTTLSRAVACALPASAALLLLLAWHDGLFQGMDIRSALSFAIFGYTLLGILFASLLGFCVLNTGSTTWSMRWLRFRPFTYLGEISYMLYLTHIPVYVAVRNLGKAITGSPFAPTLRLALIAFLFTTAIAGLSWKFYERPILRFRNVVH